MNALPLKNAYAISANDGLLREEKIEELKKKAAQAGFDERRVLALDEQDSLLAAARNSSLFAARVLIETRCYQPHLNQETESFLERLLEDISPDTLLLISLPYLPKAQRKKKWVQTLETKGQLITLYTPKGKDYIAWLGKRAKSLNLDINAEALSLIAEKNAGNLHSAVQELEKLAFYYGKEAVNYIALLDAISDDSHYESFALSDSALKGDITECQRILRQLRSARAPPHLLIWTVARDLRSLWTLNAKQQAGFRQPLLRAAQARFSGGARQRLLFLVVLAARADRAAKGGSTEDVWQLLEGLILRIAGMPSPALAHLRN